MTITIKIRQIWDALNKVLTNINIFLLIVLLAGGDPKKERKIPLIANIILLIILVSILLYTLSSYSNNGQETLKFSKDDIAANMGGGCTTTLNEFHAGHYKVPPLHQYLIFAQTQDVHNIFCSTSRHIQGTGRGIIGSILQTMEPIVTFY